MKKESRVRKGERKTIERVNGMRIWSEKVSEEAEYESGESRESDETLERKSKVRSGDIK